MIYVQNLLNDHTAHDYKRLWQFFFYRNDLKMQMVWERKEFEKCSCIIFIISFVLVPASWMQARKMSNFKTR